MFLERLKQIAARVFGRYRPWTVPPPQDPYAAVREPRKRGPGGRSAAVAVMEPDPPQSVHAVGRNAGEQL